MNLKKIYKKISISKLISIKKDKTNLDQMLKLRNQNYIRINMYNSHIIKYEEHYNWLKNFINKEYQSIYLIFFQRKYVGSIIIKNFCKKNKRADWAYYVDKKSSIFLGFLIEFKFLNFFFSNLKMNKLNCEVLEFNEKVVKLHKKFGFEIEGKKKQHIFRKKMFHDAILMGLNKKQWWVFRKLIQKKYNLL